jgi:repressor LexA
MTADNEDRPVRGPKRVTGPKTRAAARRDPTELTDRQRAILEVIHAHVDAHGYPPSVREIGDAVGLKSTSSVHAQLETLEEKGYLRRDPTKPRALELGRDPDT